MITHPQQLQSEDLMITNPQQLQSEDVMITHPQHYYNQKTINILNNSHILNNYN